MREAINGLMLSTGRRRRTIQKDPPARSTASVCNLIVDGFSFFSRRFVRLIAVSAAVIISGCGDFYYSHVTYPESNIRQVEFNAENVRKLVSENRCDVAWPIILGGVVSYRPDAEAILAEFVEDDVIILPGSSSRYFPAEKISMMLRFNAYGRSVPGNDRKLEGRLLSTAVPQPEGKKLAGCLRRARIDSEIRACAEDARHLGFTEDSIRFRLYATDYRTRAKTVRCGRG